MNRQLTLGLTAFLLLLVVPCSGAGCQSRIRWVNCSENVPSNLSLAGVDLSNLPDTLHCGQIDVPMDYSQPMAQTNMITLGLAMHRPAHPKGVLFVNTGGSDPVVIEAWKLALNQSAEFSGVADYDLMMMDVRGTFSSNPVSVSLEVAQSFPIGFPNNDTEFEAMREASAAFFQSWIDSSSPPGIIQFLRTEEVVQDYEQIRRALNYDKINYIGMSYGTYRGQRYASKFPERVGRFVLDSVVPHGRTLLDKARDQINAANRALLRADAHCQNNVSCPFHSQGQGAVPKAWHSILQNVSQAAEACAVNCSDIIQPILVQQSLHGLLLGQTDFSNLVDLLEIAVEGNPSSLLPTSSLTVEDIVAIPLECGDIGTISTAYPVSLRALISKINLYCSGWPFPVTPEPSILNLHDMLMVTADFDTDSPTEWTTFAWKRAPRSGLVVRHGDGHVSFNLFNQPATKIATEFLNTGHLPRGENESLVSVYAPNTMRAPIPDPYEVPTTPLNED
ncbi:hypothetical protein GQ53DRAFT_728953 [Thozetella sp. PMI_491]|nr:hypothetical protein GQ53DRAFT_728953 [Thozetella sp. PMI_491]